MIKASIVRKEHFNAAHRLHNNMLTDEQNKKIYGKCNNPNYHGHNYELLVKVTGYINPTTGYVIDTKYLSEIINNKIIEKFDHRNLNLDVEELNGKNPTTENVALTIYEILRKEIDNQYEMKITLYETERNYVEYPA